MAVQLRRDVQFAEPPIIVDWTLAFVRAECRKAYVYWDSIRGNKAMALRSELSPRGMLEFLTYVNLVDVLPVPENGSIDYQVSLQATHGREVFGHLTRRKIDTVLSEMTARRMCESFELVRAAARPARFQTRVTAGNKSWLDSESLLAPLGNQANQVTAIMWMFVSWRAVTT